MLVEWLVRKLFKLEKPQKGKGKTQVVNKAADKAAGKQEPLLDQVAVVGGAAAAPMAVGGATGALAGQPLPPLQAVRDAQPQQQVTPQPVAGDGKPPSILNFSAWFMADPVKSSLLIGLTILSWLATYTGMLELIQANSGSLDVFSRVAIAFSVVMLQLMILYLLDSVHSNATPTWLKPVFLAGYAFLTLISVGFGFGFYWKYLEAQTEATRSAESAVSQVQVSLQLGQTRLEQLQDTFSQLAVLSKNKADQERQRGNTCPNSRPGEGPRMRLRDEDSQKFGYAAEYITSRVATVKTDLNALNADLVKVSTREASTVSADGTRNEFLRDLGRKLDLTIARFNALATDPQIKQFRDSFDQRAGMTVFPDGKATFSCPDTQMQTALRGVVRAIDDIPEIKNPKIAAVEGSEAIVEAFRRLVTTLAALPTLKLPPSPEELRKQRTAAISAGKANAEISNIEPGLSGRDYIPLSAAVFVDLCILLISLNRRNDRFDEFHRSVAAAKTGHIGDTMLEIFEAHQNEVSRPVLEKFHHAEFEFGRDYYLAVPLFKGSAEAAYLAEIQDKEAEIVHAKQEALDENIGIHEHELHRRTADQLEAERMKKQIVDYLTSLGGQRARLLQSQKQLALSFQQQPHQQPALSVQLGSIEQKLTAYDSQIGMLEKELDGANRLLHGSGELMRQSKQELSQLRHKKTQLHEEEQNQLKKRIGVSAELDLAEDARFLSNLCVSLEANNILTLAGLWPTQKQVREKLKNHNSRYYHPEREYRVYRFRKVADNQSQMVLDLIMEAAKRARESGELTGRGNRHADKTAVPDEAPKPAEPTPEMLELERQKKDLAEARSAMDAQMLTFRNEVGALIGLMQQQSQATAAQAHAAANQPHPTIDHTAADAFYTDLGKKQRTRQADPAEQAKSREVREKISGVLGEPATATATATLVDFASRGEALNGSLDEIGAQILRQVQGGEVEATGAAVRREAPLHGITGGTAVRSALSKITGFAGGLGSRIAATRDSAEAHHLPLPALEPSPTMPSAPPLKAEREPLRAVVADATPNDPRDRVNFDSIPLPAAVPVADREEPAVVRQSVVEPAIEATEAVAQEAEPVVAEVAGPVVLPVSPQVKQKLDGRLSRLRAQDQQRELEGPAPSANGIQAAMPEDISAAVAELAGSAAGPTASSTGLARAHARLTESVDVARAIPLNQDETAPPVQPQVRDLHADETLDEPSEADHLEFGEGPPPHYHGRSIAAEDLRSDALDDMSEDMGTRAIAERLRPITKGD